MKKLNFLSWAMVVLLAVVLAPTTLAAGMPDLGEGNLSVLDNGREYIRWHMKAEYERVHLTLSTPCGMIHRTYEAGEIPSFELSELEPDDPTGSYNWQLRIEPYVDSGVREALNKARAKGDQEAVRALRRKGLLPEGPFVQSGFFEVDREGGIIDFTQVEKGGLRVDFNGDEAGEPGRNLGVITDESIGLATEKTVISGNLTVYNSICVGFDCLSNETYGADTIRLKENNLRIHAEDTSTAASFPTTDWRLEFNSNLNGGGSYFRVNDVSSSRSIMTLEANAPSHSLYVSSGGNLGVKTPTPVLDFHAVSGDTPGLRLEQDVSSGFAAQTWDLAGNETSLFIRDATNGSTLPFRIRPGASSNSLVIDDDDNVGIGILNAEAPIHIARSESPGFRLEDTSGSGVSDWDFELNANGLFQVNKAGSGGAEVLIRERQDPGGNETMDVDGSIEADAFNLSSSRTFKTGFEPVDPASVLARVIELPVSQWTFKWDERGTRHIGPMAEDFLATFGVGNDSKNISVGDVSGVALAAIQGLHQVVQEKDDRIAELEQRLAALESAVLLPAEVVEQ